MAESTVGHVFISYSRRDEAVMRRIATFLRDQGINVWVDNEKLVPGTPIWEAEIEKAIKAASAIIVVLSPDSKNSEWVRREITLSDQYRTRIFPVLVRGDEEASITLRLITRQYVDIRQNEELGLNSLRAALSFYLEELEAQEWRAREGTERQAREKAEREITEKAAREKAKRETAEKAAKEQAEREAAEKTAREQAEREAAWKAEAQQLAADKAAREKAEREDAEKAAKVKAEREAAWKAEAQQLAADKAAREKAEREAAEKAAREKAEREKSQQEVAQPTTISSRFNSYSDLQTYVQNKLLTRLRLNPSIDITNPDQVERASQDILNQILDEEQIVLTRPERNRMAVQNKTWILGKLKINYQNLGRNILNNEIVLFSDEEVVRSFNWKFAHKGKLVMTNLRLIFWDLIDQSYYFEIPISILRQAKFKRNFIDVFIIVLPTGQKLEFTVRGEAHFDRLVQKIQANL